MHLGNQLETEMQKLRAAKVLRAIKPASLPVQIVRSGDLSGVNLFILSCCDGHQFGHVVGQTFEVCTQARREFGLSEGIGEDCLHWKTTNGGPFALSVPQVQQRKYKGHTDHVDHHLLAEIDESMQLKKLNVVLLIAHARCGKVADIFTTMDEYVRYLLLAKERVMAEFNLPKEQVIAHLQTRWHGGRKLHHLDYAAAKEHLRAA